MISLDLRQQIHNLVGEANENQLDTILKILTPSKSRYS